MKWELCPSTSSSQWWLPASSCVAGSKSCEIHSKPTTPFIILFLSIKAWEYVSHCIDTPHNSLCAQWVGQFGLSPNLLPFEDDGGWVAMASSRDKWNEGDWIPVFIFEQCLCSLFGNANNLESLCRFINIGVALIHCQQKLWHNRKLCYCFTQELEEMLYACFICCRALKHWMGCCPWLLELVWVLIKKVINPSSANIGLFIIS